MTTFIPTKQHLREALLFCFNQKKKAADSFRLLEETYGQHAPTQQTCENWYKRFKSGDFDVSDKERSGQPKRFEDEDLESLLKEDSTQTEKELAKQLNVTQAAISKRLHAMKMIQKEGKWIPHELNQANIESRLLIFNSLLTRQRRWSFLHNIVTGDEKWIYYVNSKRKKSWVHPGEPSTSTAKRNIHGSKVMLCIWWDQKGVLYYELLNSNETVNAERYQQQLMKLNDALKEKRPIPANKQRTVILLHDNARPHVAKQVKNTLEALKWEILPHAAYSPDCAPSDYHLFRSMQSALRDQHFRNQEHKKMAGTMDRIKRPKLFFDGIHNLPERWSKVIINDGKYFD